MSHDAMSLPPDPFEPTQASPVSNHAIGYNRAFEDSIMQTVLAPPAEDGIILLNEGEDAPTDVSPSVVRSNIDVSTISKFGVPELPLSLDHPARIYRSTVNGVRLTHPGGFLEGGEGPGSSEKAMAAERGEFVQTLIEENRVRQGVHFWQIVDREKQDALKELKDRMQAREKAIRQNEDIEAQLVKLKEQRDLEVRVWERRMGMGKG